MTQVFTIGHSNHSFEDFVRLLAVARTAVLVDVRSRPYSRYNPQFDRPGLAAALQPLGVPYIWAGHRLGGFTDDPSLKGADGRPDYEKMRGVDSYVAGIDDLVRGVEAGLGPFCLMCSEEDPVGCHRRRLVGADLVRRGHDLVHVRGDGTLEAEREVRERAGENQPSVLDVFGS